MSQIFHLINIVYDKIVDYMLIYIAEDTVHIAAFVLLVKLFLFLNIKNYTYIYKLFKRKCWE